MTRLEWLLGGLQQFYGPLPPPPADAFTLFVWDILSSHAGPRKRDAAFGALKRSRAYLYLSHLGVAICTQADPDCHACPLRDDCPYGKSR